MKWILLMSCTNSSHYFSHFTVSVLPKWNDSSTNLSLLVEGAISATTSKSRAKYSAAKNGRNKWITKCMSPDNKYCSSFVVCDCRRLRTLSVTFSCNANFIIGFFFIIIVIATRAHTIFSRWSARAQERISIDYMVNEAKNNQRDTICSSNWTKKCEKIEVRAKKTNKNKRKTLASL